MHRTLTHRTIRTLAGLALCFSGAVAGGCFQEPAPTVDGPDGYETEAELTTGDPSEGLFCDLCAAQGCDCEGGECVDCGGSNYTSGGDEAEGLFCDLCAAQGCDCEGGRCVDCEAGSFTMPDRGEVEGLFCDLCAAQGCDCEGGQCVDCGGGKLTIDDGRDEDDRTLEKTR
jgi:hypothetical protein